jgi:hypothetical protein
MRNSHSRCWKSLTRVLKTGGSVHTLAGEYDVKTQNREGGIHTKCDCMLNSHSRCWKSLTRVLKTGGSVHTLAGEYDVRRKTARGEVTPIVLACATRILPPAGGGGVFRPRPLSHKLLNEFISPLPCFPPAGGAAAPHPTQPPLPEGRLSGPCLGWSPPSLGVPSPSPFGVSTSCSPGPFPSPWTSSVFPPCSS